MSAVAMPASVEPHAVIDPQRFRQLLGCFPTGVAIITTRTAAGEPVGLTCNSFSSVSLEPPLVLFSLRKASRLVDVFATAPGFAINILSQSQDALSGRFASSKIADKFEGVAWHAGVSGWPVIDQCLASFECSVFARHEAGDHDVYIGQVRHMGARPGDDALVYYKGAYKTLAESLRAQVLEGRLGDADIDEAYRAVYGTLLRLACERASTDELDAVAAAAHAIEQHGPHDAMELRIDTASRFFQSIAEAGHNQALWLMAQTLTTLLRERMMHVNPVRPRPDLFPLRRRLVACLRERDAQAATAGLDELITRLRAGAQTP